MGEVEDDRLKAVYAWRTGRLIHDYFGKNALALDKSYTPSLNLSLGTSRSYNRSENVTREYAGSMIRAGELANLTAAERDLTVKGSTVESKDVSLAAKGNVRLEAGENTSVTTTANKYSSASVGASFGINGLSDISVNVNRARGNSKETNISYTPALIRAEENAVITSGKDTDIIGSKVQGDKVTARVGGNLNIETLQEKETYEEQNTSAGFGISWNVNLFDGKTKQLATPDSESVYRKFSKPNIGGSFSKGNISSHYKSARDQAGIFAGTGGFDLLVGKNTDLKGGLIASKATADKNKLSTGTFSFSGLKKNPTAIGPGTVLYVTSDGPVQAALEKGEAYTLDTITDPTEIADIIGRQNTVLQSFPEESRSVLRPAVIEEHGGEDIHVYQATGDYAKYNFLLKNCLSFAKYIIGGYSEELNNFSNTSFYDSRLWRDK